ncbi:MAG: nucleotide exchange factor GrpE [Armatimonadota bacterium]|nr:nucleotide exchange factor GrpE [Armatimonadota bacterium]MDR7549377.1 nucleotide exchange factor GrpE [Armatimonadota bacterium]
MDRERSTNGDIQDVPGSQAGEAATGEVETGEGTTGEVETIETLRAEVARLSEEAERNWQQFLRTAADLENYRKQAARQRDEAVAATRRALLGVILVVVDTLERALEHAGSLAGDAGGGAPAAAIVDGIRLAHRQVLETLKSLGVEPMETVGQAFDPRVHEAVEAVPAGDGTEPGTVVGEVQRGYMLGGDVLRPARVRVAQ